MRPGSWEARNAGCRCVSAANGWGRGEPGSTPDCPTYQIDPSCRVHPAGFVPQPLPIPERVEVVRGLVVMDTLRKPRTKREPKPKGPAGSGRLGTCVRCGDEGVRLSIKHGDICTEAGNQRGCARHYRIVDGKPVRQRSEIERAKRNLPARNAARRAKRAEESRRAA